MCAVKPFTARVGFLGLLMKNINSLSSVVSCNQQNADDYFEGKK